MPPKRKPPEPDDSQAAYDAAIRLLNYRWRAQQELVRRLGEKGFGEGAIRDAVIRLEREGWIDDRRFALEYARSKIRKEGPFRIERRLVAFGVDGSVAAEASRAAVSDDSARVALERLARKKIASSRARKGNAYRSSEVGRRKLADWLFSRGYEREAIDEVVDELLKGQAFSDEDDE